MQTVIVLAVTLGIVIAPVVVAIYILRRSRMIDKELAELRRKLL